MGKSDAKGLFAAVAELVEQGLGLDEAIEASGSDFGPDELAEAMETKRRITAAIFALLPATLDAAPGKKPAILEMIHQYDQSHQRITSILPAVRRLRRFWRDGQVLETYLPEPALRQAA